MADDQVLSARWVFPADTPPLEGGTVTVRAGRIAAVEPRGSRTPDLDFGNAAIIPGLVNAHAHLDLSGLRGRVPPSTDFVGWLRGVIAHRRAQPPASVAADIQAGLAEALRYGTTLIGDIAAGGSSWEALSSAPTWAVCFRELLGLPSGRVPTVWADVVTWMHDHPDTPTCRAGVSPHAPFSVHKALIEAAARLWPVCVHLAESESERELIEKRTGPFVPFLKDLGVWDPNGLAPSWDWVAWKVSRSPAGLLAHGNHLTPNAIPEGAAVVYCPRTHAAFGHPPHPFREFLDRGVRVALGTDSLASNPDLDVLAEARHVYTSFANVPGGAVLRMATLNGAEALGFGRETGSLTVGKSADLVLIPLSDAAGADPYSLLFGAELEAERRTMWRGDWRVGDPEERGPVRRVASM